MSQDTLQTTQGPQTLNHVIGQKAVIEQARIAMDAAFQDGQPFPSTLMTGPPGLGKSMIAQVIAREMASRKKIFSVVTAGLPDICEHFCWVRKL